LGFFIRRVKVIKSMEPEVKTQYDAESNAEGKACKDI